MILKPRKFDLNDLGIKLNFTYIFPCRSILASCLILGLMAFELVALGFEKQPSRIETTHTCWIGGVARISADSKKCPLRGRECDKSFPSFRCGKIFGEVCVPQQPQENLTERCAQESRKIYPNSRDLPFVQLNHEALRETQIEILNSFNRFCLEFQLDPSRFEDKADPCLLVSERLKELGLWNSPETAELSNASTQIVPPGRTEQKDPRFEIIQSPQIGVVWSHCPQEIRSTVYWKLFLDILNFELDLKRCELSKIRIEVDCTVETERIQNNGGERKLSSIGLKIHEFGNQATNHKKKGFLAERVLSFPKFLNFSDPEDSQNSFFVPDYGSIPLRLRMFFSKHDICEGDFRRKIQPTEKEQPHRERSEEEITSREDFIALNGNSSTGERVINFLTDSFPYNLSAYIQRNTEAMSIINASNCRVFDSFSISSESLERVISFFQVSFSDNTKLLILPLSLGGIDDLNKDGNLPNKMYRLKYLVSEESPPFGLFLKTNVSQSILKTEKLDNLDPQKEESIRWHWYNETDGIQKNIDHIAKIELNQAIEHLTRRNNRIFSDNKACFLQRLLKY